MMPRARTLFTALGLKDTDASPTKSFIRVAYAVKTTALRETLLAELKQQNDPRALGQGDFLDGGNSPWANAHSGIEAGSGRMAGSPEIAAMVVHRSHLHGNCHAVTSLVSNPDGAHSTRPLPVSGVIATEKVMKPLRILLAGLNLVAAASRLAADALPPARGWAFEDRGGALTLQLDGQPVAEFVYRHAKVLRPFLSVVTDQCPGFRSVPNVNNIDTTPWSAIGVQCPRQRGAVVQRPALSAH